MLTKQESRLWAGSPDVASGIPCRTVLYAGCSFYTSQKVGVAQDFGVLADDPELGVWVLQC